MPLCNTKALPAQAATAAASMALAILIGAASMTLGVPGAAAQDQDMMKLQDQLRACRGDDCAGIREQMMTRMRDRLQNCVGNECQRLRDRLSLHEQMRDCPVSERRCRELRSEEREQVRPRFSYGDRSGRNMGMGMSRDADRQMGRGMDN